MRHERCLGRFVRRIEGFQRQFGQRDIDSRSEHCDCAQERQDAGARAQAQGNDDGVLQMVSGAVVARCLVRCGVGIRGDLFEEFVDGRVARNATLPLQSIQQMSSPLRKVLDERSEAFRVQAQAHEVHGWFPQLRIGANQERGHGGVGADERP